MPYQSFHHVWRLLSSVETFIQYGDFQPVWTLLSRVESFGDFYLV